MGNCALCNKQLGVFEGYNDFGKEYCKSCFNKKNMKEDKKLINSMKKKQKQGEDL